MKEGKVVVQIIHGDLLQAEAKFICHQVNCQGVMGSGVAKQIRAKWPVVFKEYRELCDSYRHDRGSLLGRAQYIKVGNMWVVNLFGQNQFGRDGKMYTSPDALLAAFVDLAAIARPNDMIAMPYRIGCGLGGGEWGMVMDLLVDTFWSNRVTLYKR